jgi:hypothetical protein
MRKKLFEKIELHFKNKKLKSVVDGKLNSTDAVFSDSEIMDIYEMIDNGLMYDDIISIIDQW